MNEQLKQLRISSRLTPAEVAKRMGGNFTAQNVEEMEKGTRSLGISSVQSFAYACGYEFIGNFEKMIIHDLDFIRISIDAHREWTKIIVPQAVVAIQDKYGQIKSDEVFNEKFREFPDGSGEIFLVFRELRFVLKVPKGQWEFMGLN